MLTLGSKNYGSSWIQHEAVKTICKAENKYYNIQLINLKHTIHCLAIGLLQIFCNILSITFSLDPWGDLY